VRRQLKIDVTLPIYEVEPGKCLVPAGLDRDTIEACSTREIKARVEVPSGLVVGFACVTEGLRIVSLRVGRDAVRFSSAGFVAEAVADGIAIPAHPVAASMEIAATLENLCGIPVIPSAFFWIEVDRVPPRSRPGRGS